MEVKKIKPSLLEAAGYRPLPNHGSSKVKKDWVKSEGFLGFPRWHYIEYHNGTYDLHYDKYKKHGRHIKGSVLASKEDCKWEHHRILNIKNNV